MGNVRASNRGTSNRYRLSRFFFINQLRNADEESPVAEFTFGMKTDTRSSTPVLVGNKLAFFYSILTLWESPDNNKVVKDFNSSEIKRFLNHPESSGKKLLYITHNINKTDYNCKYFLYVNNSKKNIGLSLLYHLRNSFAHNDIQLSDNGMTIVIHHEYNGVLKLKTKIPYKVLKYLIETIRGKHNLTEEEKKQKPSKRKKHK